MTKERGKLDQLWFWFSASSLLFLVVLAVSPVKDFFREYRSYQNDYRERLLELAGSSRELREVREQRVRVRQIWIPEFGNRVDRCVSCHLGVENPKMAGASQPFGFHPQTPHTPDDFQEFGCVACHRGQGRATSRDEAHGETPDWHTPLLPVRYTEASCGRCHLGETVQEASLLSRGRRLMSEYGCYACHSLEGYENWRSDAPPLDGLGRKTDPAWLRAWLDAPRSIKPNTRMPDFQLTGGEIDSLVAFLWVQPLLPSQDISPDQEPAAGDAERGGKLFRESRCISCHTVDGRGNASASELGGIGSKVNRRWLVAFLQNPHAFQPDTRMPRYNFSTQDLLDVSQYMIDELYDPDAPPPADPLRPSQKMVLAGERIYRRYGCAGCHQIAGREDLVRIGPELTGIGEKPVALLDFGRRHDLPRTSPDWLAAKVTEPRSFREGLKMPRFGFDEEETEAIVTALLSTSSRPVPEKYRVVPSSADYEPPGRFGELVGRYRCLSCHQVQGVGGDISTAPLTAEGSRVRKDWLTDYLLRPSTIRPILTDRMVPLWMLEEEAAFLADFMQNVYVSNDIPGEILPEDPDPTEIERGRQLFYERYGCQACHMIEGRGGYYGPLLDEAGRRLKPGWVSWWLLGPQRWRADVRCADYGMDEADAEDLAAFITALGRPDRAPREPEGG